MAFTTQKGGGAKTLVITDTDVFDMANHWLNTPIDGYLGMDYGSDPKSLLQKPMQGLQADAFVRKLRSDVPLLNQLSEDSVGVYFVNDAPDTKNLFLEVGNNLLPINT